MSPSPKKPRYRRKSKSRIKVPYLGKVSLFWCHTCHVPLLDNIPCALCHNKGKKVAVSPPGDIRPAFSKDISILRDVINRTYGSPVGDVLFASHHIVLLNRIGGLDRTEEVVLNGIVIGILQFDLFKQDFVFFPRLSGGTYIFQIMQQLNNPPRKQILLQSEAIPFIFAGKSILAPGVESFSQDLSPGDPVLIIAPNEQGIKELIGIGITRGTSAELYQMKEQNHGMLAKNKFHRKSWENVISLPFELFNPENLTPSTMESIRSNLQQVYFANEPFITRKIASATKFIQQVITTHNHPIAVAYSGGKDSLGALLLVYQVLGPNFKIFFADTGLELPEVVNNIHQVAEILQMEDKLVLRYAEDTFWRILEDFGPPGRDYRYCCHSLKAQQITEIINTMYEGKKVLTFLGQRQYESLSRAQSKLVYVNSFIPLQVAATPIKEWNALLLWLFILFHPVYEYGTTNRLKIPITPLYFQGHERLGCYLCPAANLASFRLLENSHPELHAKWFNYLHDYANQYKLPAEYIQYGLWRFKKLSPQWKNLVQSLNLPTTPFSYDPSVPIQFHVTKGFSPCLQSGYSVKGKFSTPLDLDQAANFLIALDSGISYDEELNVISISSIYNRQPYRVNIFADGALFLLSPSKEFDHQSFLKLVVGSILRSISCNQCKTCESICPTKAISIEASQIRIDPDLCTQCRTCITHCPLFQIAKQMVDL
jgi:phosphoadenosine phosphosulfate reductase